jgi:hypothetical protein
MGSRSVAPLVDHFVLGERTHWEGDDMILERLVSANGIEQLHGAFFPLMVVYTYCKFIIVTVMPGD